MVDTARSLADAEPVAAQTTYEQPLSERMRTFLRIEFLRAQADYQNLKRRTLSDIDNIWSHSGENGTTMPRTCAASARAQPWRPCSR